MLFVFSLSVNLFPFSSLYNLSASPSSRHIFLDYFYIFLQCYSNFSPSIYNATPTLILQLLASYYFLFPSVRLLFDSLNLPIAVLLSSEHWKEISSTACCNSICCSFFYRCRQCYRCCQCCRCCALYIFLVNIGD